MQIIDVNKFYDDFSKYTELRVQENSSTKVSIVNGDVMTNSKTSCAGTSARVT